MLSGFCCCCFICVVIVVCLFRLFSSCLFILALFVVVCLFRIVCCCFVYFGFVCCLFISARFCHPCSALKRHSSVSVMSWSVTLSKLKRHSSVSVVSWSVTLCKLKRHSSVGIRDVGSNRFLRCSAVLTPAACIDGYLPPWELESEGRGGGRGARGYLIRAEKAGFTDNSQLGSTSAVIDTANEPPPPLLHTHTRARANL